MFEAEWPVSAESVAPAGRGIPPRGVARRLHMANMLAPRALRSGRRAPAIATDSAETGHSVQGLLRPSRAARVVAPVCRWAAGRQCAQVDVGHARAGHRADLLPSVPALHHARAVGCRGRVAALAAGHAGAHGHSDPRRDELPEGRAPFRRRRAPVLRGAGQGGQLPGGGDRRALGGPAGVAHGRLAVRARGVDARSGAVCGGGHPGDGDLSRKMAVGPHPVAAHAGGRRDADRGGRRRRIRGQPHRSASPAPPAPPLCRGHLAEPDGVSRHPDAAYRSPAAAAPQPPRGLARSGSRRRLDAERRAARTGVAACRMAQWHQPAVGRRFRRTPGHAGHRLATAPARARGVAALRAWARADRPPQTLLRRAARRGDARAGRAAGASAVGHRTALPGSQDASWASTTSKGGAIRAGSTTW